MFQSLFTGYDRDVMYYAVWRGQKCFHWRKRFRNQYMYIQCTSSESHFEILILKTFLKILFSLDL